MISKLILKPNSIEIKKTQMNAAIRFNDYNDRFKNLAFNRHNCFILSFYLIGEFILPEIPQNLISMLCCPVCKGMLRFESELIICKNCKKKFNIIDGIIYFVTSKTSNPSSLFRQYWKQKLKNIDRFPLKPDQYNKFDEKLINYFCSPIKNKILLDAGCGTGLSTINLLNLDTFIIFFDIIPEALQIVKKIVKIRNKENKVLFIVGDLTCLPLQENSVDVIWSGGVLEHFESIKEPYIEIFRVLKPSGHLLFTIPNKFGFQRILSSIKEIIYPRIDHFETGFLFSKLVSFFPAKLFGSSKITTAGIRRDYEKLILPFLPKVRCIQRMVYIIFKFSIKFLSKLSSQLKIGLSWFILYGKKKENFIDLKKSPVRI